MKYYRENFYTILKKKINDIITIEKEHFQINEKKDYQYQKLEKKDLDVIFKDLSRTGYITDLLTERKLYEFDINRTDKKEMMLNEYQYICFKSIVIFLKKYNVGYVQTHMIYMQIFIKILMDVSIEVSVENCVSLFHFFYIFYDKESLPENFYSMFNKINDLHKTMFFTEVFFFGTSMSDKVFCKNFIELFFYFNGDKLFIYNMYSRLKDHPNISFEDTFSSSFSEYFINNLKNIYYENNYFDIKKLNKNDIFRKINLKNSFFFDTDFKNLNSPLKKKIIYGWDNDNLLFFNKFYPYLKYSKLFKTIEYNTSFFENIHNGNGPIKIDFSCNNINDVFIEKLCEGPKRKKKKQFYLDTFEDLKELNLEHNFLTYEKIKELIKTKFHKFNKLEKLNLCFQYPALTDDENKELIKIIRFKKPKTEIKLSSNRMNEIIQQIQKEKKNLVNLYSTPERKFPKNQKQHNIFTPSSDISSIHNLSSVSSPDSFLNKINHRFW